MGSSLKPEKMVIHYYNFQRKLELYLKGGIYKTDKEKLKEGYILNYNRVLEWKRRINYDEIEEYLFNSKISKNKLDKNQENAIYNFIKKNINNIYNSSNYYSQTTIREYLQFKEKILTKKYLQTIVNKKIFESFKINEKYTEKIYYLFKKRMLILIYPYYKIIKMIISSLEGYSEERNIINLTFLFNDISFYENYRDIFTKNSSNEIILILIDFKIFEKPIYEFSPKDKLAFQIINEEKYIKERIQTNSLNNIKAPNEINYNLINRPSFRGLDNVGATCYMNATLQCLANIRPITESLLRESKYQEIYNNRKICRLTLEYCQVLIGLYCNSSTTGSYRPEQFKNTIGELNSLFQGVQANDSKDLIIFLLETLNSELVNLRNLTRNIKEVENGINFQIDPTNKIMVFNEFQKEFEKNYCSYVGYNLCGIQNNIFKCQLCGAISNNFNVYNFLIFGLETISNYYNLSKNNTQLPIITFDHCFNYMSKKELFDQTYCQKCKKTGKAEYKEGIYMMPNYLIIVLNRGKGNIFNCRVDIPEIFSSSKYSELEKNANFELVGIVSHLGESGMGGHFIAFCKHNMDNKWRIYNDSIVVECQNDYLTKGIPYILFYKKTSVNNTKNINQNNINNQNPNFNNFQQINNINFTNQPQQQIVQNANMNFFNNIQSNMQNMQMNNLYNPQQNMFMINNNVQQINNYQPNLNAGLNNPNIFNNGMNMNPNMGINQNMENNNIGFQPCFMNMNLNSN